MRGFGARIHGRARIARPWHLPLQHRACLGDRAQTYALGKIEVGPDTTIAHEPYLCAGTHDFRSPALPLLTAPTRVGRGAFVDARNLVLPGLTLDEGCIVGAGAVVTRGVHPYAIVVGNPTHVIGHRPRGSLPGDPPVVAAQTPCAQSRHHRSRLGKRAWSLAAGNDAESSAIRDLPGGGSPMIWVSGSRFNHGTQGSGTVPTGGSFRVPPIPKYPV